jgi:L-lactate utilization protein LutB
MTGDTAVDKKNQDKAVAKAQGFLRDKRKAMDTFKKDSDKLRKLMDTTKPSTVKKFEDKLKEFYYGKAVFEAVQ